MPKLPDYKAYALLKKYKIPIAPFMLAKNVKQAHAAAEKFGYPLVLKIDAEIIHKAKAGCVKIINKAEESMPAFNEIMKNAKKLTKKISGVIVQPLVKGSELIIGGKRDPSFGTVIMFGSGGVLADLLKDVTFRVLPVERFDAELMIGETKAPDAIPALQSPRTQRQVADILLKTARLLEANPKITELDINPLFLTERGALAADVRIIEK
jgi:acetyl-CoA synthetase (ADP-forming)